MSRKPIRLTDTITHHLLPGPKSKSNETHQYGVPEVTKITDKSNNYTII